MATCETSSTKSSPGVKRKRVNLSDEATFISLLQSMQKTARYTDRHDTSKHRSSSNSLETLPSCQSSPNLIMICSNSSSILCSSGQQIIVKRATGQVIVNFRGTYTSHLVHLPRHSSAHIRTPLHICQQVYQHSKRISLLTVVGNNVGAAKSLILCFHLSLASFFGLTYFNFCLSI